jgi:glycerophosphoryl diester phosphodiesterase
MTTPYLDHVVPFGLAHRGGTEVAPGNTIAAFDHAHSLGFDYIETDVRLTSDGVLAVFHDDDLAPTTGVPGSIESKTWAELSQLRVGGEHAIPRLDDVLDRYPTIRFNIEPKGDGAVDPLVALIRNRGAIERIGVGSFSDRRVRRMRKSLGPGLATSPGPIGLGFIVVAAAVWPWWRSAHAAVQVPRRYGILPLVNRFLVSRYHRMGLQVHVWTINTETDIRELFALGVDAVMSDEVSVLRHVLRDLGAWPSNPGEATRGDAARG